ncbi:cilia- and flagella-associated protein 77 isoform X2 [Cyprinodon tularosa]|uniref:cilia- and flagella-associated protein 77 isoform X2 n=1 Tax=Cyprinodon tularosa TaxID=77115 RepID=UPI0018E22385|nr:cilia- and flagella-associated protein 77 isoform X2 [Cyprinodon tularosa]
MTTASLQARGRRNGDRVKPELFLRAGMSDVRGSMTSPRLGVVRKSMLMDPLLIKAPLGRARSRGLALPGPDFTYGIRSSINDGGVAEAISSWKVHTRREESTQKRDFVSLNRDAVKSGLVKSKRLSQNRVQQTQTHTARQQHSRTFQHQPVVPDTRFGVKTRPSTPLADILSNQYAHRWMEKQLERNQTSNHRPTNKAGKFAETKSSLLRRNRPLPVSQTPFKLPQFSQVPPALDTFRDPGARPRALKAPQQPQTQRGGPDHGTNSLD